MLPSGLQSGDNDSRILAVALSLSNDGLPVTVVSKDLPLRVKAASIGLAAEEYRAELAPQSGWTGIAEIELSADDMARLYDDDRLSSRVVGDLPVNTGLVIHSDRGSALGRVVGRGELRLVRADRDVFGLHGRSAEQRIAIDLLLDPEIGIVSLGGRAGTGSRRWPSAQDSRRYSSGSSTTRSWSSARSTRSVARISGSFPGTRGRR